MSNSSLFQSTVIASASDTLNVIKSVNLPALATQVYLPKSDFLKFVRLSEEPVSPNMASPLLYVSSSSS